MKDLVCYGKGFGKGCFFGCDVEEILVWDYDQCIDMILELVDIVVGYFYVVCVFEVEWFGDNVNCQNVYVVSCVCYNWCSVCVCVIVYVGGDEYYVCIGQVFMDFVDGFFGRLCIDFWLCVCVQFFGDCGIYLYVFVCL